MDCSEIEALKNQLTLARNEIKNLRQQVQKLSTIHSKEVDNINKILQTFHCQNCGKPDSNLDEIGAEAVSLTNKDICMKKIGMIRTVFPEKKAVPRQTSVGSEIQGRIVLDPNVFTNPEHSLEGLEEFSHMWILYYFHKNIPHAKAKIAPPRLDGKKIGVFSCRSPHRPNPIGLSLVRIEKIENSTIYFVGTDMVDETPLLDIKPYIPQYDDPFVLEKTTSNDQQDFYNARQPADGEEQIKNPILPSSSTNTTTPITNVKVAKWTQANAKLKVIFTEQALTQLAELKLETSIISEILSAEPRSVYLRQTFKSQLYAFQISDVTVTSKFNDESSIVTVLQVKKPDIG